MARNKYNSTTTIRVVCAIVFLIFVFSYVFCYQSDVLALAQHIWSGGETHYNDTVGAILITVVLFIIQLGVSAAVRLPHRAYAVSFAPSLILLGVLSSASLQADSSMSIGFWAVVALFLLLGVGFAIKLLSDYASCESPLHGISIVSSQAAWYNYGLLAVFMFVTFCMGNNDRKLHAQLKLERSTMNRYYSDALDVAPLESNASMTLVRAYALSCRGELGERLFEYPLSGGSRALLPSKDASIRTLLMPDSLIWRNLGGYPRKEVKNVRHFLRILQQNNVARPSVDDYMLTSYLLDRDLLGFAKEAVKIYDFRTQQEKDEEMEIIEKKRKRLARIIGEKEAADSIRPVVRLSPTGCELKSLDSIPKHFQEALVLYTHLHSLRVLTYTNSAMDVDYEDFLKVLRSKKKSKAEYDNALKSAYFGTYWWYYYK